MRLDRDATRRQERLEEILGAFGRGEAQVLVGTQMISKGHHFPGVTLVVVADGDLGLNLPDYRSSERTFTNCWFRLPGVPDAVRIRAGC